MGLADRLAQPPEPDARRARAAAPKGFEPGVRFEAGEPAEVVVALTEIPEDERKWREEITKFTQLPIPEERRVVLSQVRYWGDPGAPYIYCRFLIEDRDPEVPGIDALSILRQLRKRRPVKRGLAGESTFCLSINDLQVGKKAGGGTEALAERLDRAYTEAHQRIRELRSIGRDLGRLVVIGGGDIIEGCSIFPNQPFEIDSDRHTQVRNAVTLIMDGLDRLAPQFERVTVLVVGGNHGENRIDGKRSTRHDNDDCLVFEHIATAAARDPRLQHVDFVIAQDEPAKTLDVNGWILATTHGHVFGKTPSGAIEQKAYKWFCGQAAGRQPAGDADLLVTHHFHHYAARDWGACLWVQAPAMDGGSPFYTDFSGQAAEPGLLSWAMSREQRFADPQILGLPRRPDGDV